MSLQIGIGPFYVLSGALIFEKCALNMFIVSFVKEIQKAIEGSWSDLTPIETLLWMMVTVVQL